MALVWLAAGMVACSGDFSARQPVVRGDAGESGAISDGAGASTIMGAPKAGRGGASSSSAGATGGTEPTGGYPGTGGSDGGSTPEDGGTGSSIASRGGGAGQGSGGTNVGGTGGTGGTHAAAGGGAGGTTAGTGGASGAPMTAGTGGSTTELGCPDACNSLEYCDGAEHACKSLVPADLCSTSTEGGYTWKVQVSRTGTWTEYYCDGDDPWTKICSWVPVDDWGYWKCPIGLCLGCS